MNILGEEEEKSFRDQISTVDEDGKRVWLYPKKPSGRFYNARMWVSAGFLAFLFLAPFIQVGGRPLMLFDVLNRRFIIFGQLFTPQDFHLFVLSMILFIVFIALFTVTYGRVFCGWVCPQTIFMESVFRRIEYWIEGTHTQQRKLDAAPWTGEKVWKKTAKHTLFVLISALITHTFLAYIIGIDELWQLFKDTPVAHPGLFASFVVFTGLFYGVFAFFREQVCTTACPYGRLQSVLLTDKSVVVAYDDKRGEPRAKGRRPAVIDTSGEEPKMAGDCVDCHLCVAVCPTGIDIRNGTQMECVNCTACIDACDHVMDKVGLPRGLVRYASQEEIDTGKPFSLKQVRTVAYTIVMLLIMTAITALMVVRTDIETVVTRADGTTWQITPEDRVQNMFTVLLINKTDRTISVAIKLKEEAGNIQIAGTEDYTLKPEETFRAAALVDFSKEDAPTRDEHIHFEIYADGELMATEKSRFLAPFKQKL